MKLPRANLASVFSPANRTLICTWHQACCLMAFLVEEDMLVKVHLLMKDLVLQAQLPILFQKI
jgi:hypothetical protein